MKSPAAATRAAVALLALASFAEPASATWQRFQAAADGLAENRVLCIAEDGTGAIWFGTRGGASRFDGTRWVTVVDSLPHQTVNALLEDRQGHRWFATNDGIARFDGAAWKRWSLGELNLPTTTAHAALEDHRGDVWIGASDGLLRYEPAADRWTTYLEAPGGLVNHQAWELMEDRERRLWIATPEGVSRLDPTRTQWTTYVQDPGALGRDSVFALGEGADGSIWFGTDLGAWRLGPAGWSQYSAADGLSLNPVYAIARDSLDRMWFGGELGVSRFDGRTFRIDTRSEDGQFIGRVSALHTDRSGNIWIGTQEGAFRFDGTGWRHYFSSTLGCGYQESPNIPNEFRLGSNCVTAMLEDAKGDRWFATTPSDAGAGQGGGVARLRTSGVWSNVRRASGVPVSDSLTAIAEDATRGLWLGSQAAGIAHSDSLRAAWTLHRRTTGLPGDSIRTLFVDARGDVWAGTTNGAGRWSGGAWARHLHGGVDGQPVEVLGFLEDDAGTLWMRTSLALFSLDPSRTQLRRWSEADGLADPIVNAMIETGDGSTWFGTPRGLSRRTAAGAWNTWNQFGTPGDSVVHSLREARSGDVWVGTDYDAARWNGASWTTYTGVEIGSTPVTGIFEDESGTMWLAAFAGLGRFNGDDWRRYDNRGNGLAANQITGFLTDSQHRLWFASDGGLTEHQPDRVAPQTVFVNTVPRLSPSRNVSFVFGSAYGETVDLEYATSWDGSPDGAWTSDNTWALSGVPDGLHTFSVRARDWVRNVDPSPAVYTFEVDATPPAALVTAPRFGEPVRGAVAIMGDATDARFDSLAVEARPAGTPSWTSPAVVSLGRSGAPVSGDTLAVWNTTGLAEGDWEIRLSVTDTLGLVGAYPVRVIVDNQAPFANVTSPVRINALEGGDVYTTAADVHLHFPPRAFDQDAVVSVDPLTAAEAPDTLPNGAVRRGAAWEIAWPGAQLVKSATLAMRPAPAAGSGSLAIYTARTGTSWQRVGGSPSDGGGRELALTESGRYALYSEASIPEPGGSVTDLTLAPRVFSPRGSFGSTDMAIGFTLGRAGAVTVRIFNRSGRLVRTVAEGQSGTPGANLVRWDGRDRDGQVVVEGIYLVTVEALGETRTQTLAVAK